MADLTTKAINTYGLNDETLGLGHKVLVVGDSAEYLTLVSDIAKKIVEDYAGSTLAGSAQSIANAFTQLQKANIFTIPETVITENTNLNTLNAIGTYRCGGSAVASTLVNSPITNEGFVLFVTNGLGSSVRIQIAYSATGKLLSMRQMSSDGSNATDWVTYANKVEMDAVTNKVSAIVGMSDPGSMTSYSTQQFTVASSSRHLIIISGAKSVVHGLLLVSVNSSGGVFLTPIHVGDGLVITAPSNNVLQVENTSNIACYFTDICTNGTAITKVTAGTNSAQSESI